MEMQVSFFFFSLLKVTTSKIVLKQEHNIVQENVSWQIGHVLKGRLHF